MAELPTSNRGVLQKENLEVILAEAIFSAKQNFFRRHKCSNIAGDCYI